MGFCTNHPRRVSKSGALARGVALCYSWPRWHGDALPVGSAVNAKQIWQAALVELERRVTRANFETWVRHVGAVSLENGVLTLSAPSTFAQM